MEVLTEEKNGQTCKKLRGIFQRADEANNNKAKLPITALINQFYCDLQDMGGGRFDTSSLIKRL